MRIALVLGLAACGSAAAPPSLPKGSSSARPGVPPPSDEGGFRKLLTTEVSNGGLWFADAECQTRFGASGKITAEAFDAFARCVAMLQLRPTGRRHWADDTSVLTDAAGFEIEARVAGRRLDYIGFAGRAPGMPDLPSITVDALEKLRVEGDPNATLTSDDAKSAVPEKAGYTHLQYLKLCISESGDTSIVLPAHTSLLSSVDVFTAIVRDWKFRPFVAGGKPMAVCAVPMLQYPAAPRAERRLPRPPVLSKAGKIVYNVHPKQLEGRRLTGNKNVVPDDVDKIHLNGKRLVGSFRLCLDETGHYESGTLLGSTSVSRYDAKIAREMMQWVYKPFIVDGNAIPFCSVVTFIYTQNK